MSFDTISFLSDFGVSDESVGVTKSVIWSIAPTVRIVDITHGIDAHDVRAGGLALARAANYLLPGVVLGVIDPGTGSDRKPVCIEVGAGQSYLVGPDNGLFAPAVGMVGGATNAWVLDNPDFHIEGIGSTFAGRDVFAPVAAHLTRGVPPERLGTPIDPALLLPGVLPVAQLNDDGRIEAEVLWIDRFGNVQLNVDPDDVAGWPAVRIEADKLERAALPVHTYAAVTTGSIGILADASGLLSLAVDRGSAADELRLMEGDQLKLSRTEVPGRQVAVKLGATKENPER
ncbi:MAG: SAM-dependent chlorinase/fluorinase [Acidimicrobiales bacterium]|nr:SAM-dependent chlorinase/fluorinase [Acidimicrobiales bacterium]